MESLLCYSLADYNNNRQREGGKMENDDIFKIELANGDFFFGYFQMMDDFGRFVFLSFLPGKEIPIPIEQGLVRNVSRVSLPELLLYCNWIAADRPKIDKEMVATFLGVVGKNNKERRM